MAGKDVKRASELRRLFDEQLAKVNHSKDHAGRQQEAASLMDRLVGREWRGEVALPGVEIVEVELSQGPTAAEPASFYDKVHGAMRDEGLDFNNDEPEDEHEEHEKREHSLRERLMCAFNDALSKVLGE